MTKKELQERTQAFALNVLRLGSQLPQQPEFQVVRQQLIRSGTGVGANYRAACRARSAREFVAKLGVVEEEADESCFWFDLLLRLGVNSELLADLRQEANELTAIAAASRKTARSNY